MTKSVTSTLVGIAISEGRLRLDERLSQMLPRYAAEMTPSVARVTLRQLLTHTAGFTDTWNIQLGELAASPDWVRFILKHQDYAPVDDFHYSDYGAHLLSPILVQATGQSVLAYARAKLFDPLGIVTRPGIEPPADEAHLPEYQRAAFAWPVDPQGFQLAFALLKLRPRDMATFGQLFLQNGAVERPAGRAGSLGTPSHDRAGRQVVPRLRQLGPRLRVQSDKLRLLLVGGTHRRCHRLLRVGIRRAADRGRAITAPGHRRVLQRRRDAPRRTCRRSRRGAAPGRRDRANHQDPSDSLSQARRANHARSRTGLSGLPGHHETWPTTVIATPQIALVHAVPAIAAGTIDPGERNTAT